MRTRFFHTSLVTVGIAAVGLLGTGFAFVQGHEKGGETPVDVTKLPAPVQATAKKVFGKLDGLKATQETQRGVVLYEVVGKGAEGMDLTFTCVAGGQVNEVERQIPMNQLPADAAANLQKAFPGATLLSAEEVESHYFEVKLKTDGQEKKVVVGASGAVYMEEEEGEEGEEGEEEGG